MDSLPEPTDPTEPPQGLTGPPLELAERHWIRVVDLSAWKVPGAAPAGAVRTLGLADLPVEVRGPARFGGALLALAGLHALGGRGFVVTVGESVAQGQATAARATVIARSPMHGRWSQGQFGSDWARCFARWDRVVILIGAAPWADAVLRQGEHGRVFLETVPGLESVDSTERPAVISQALGAGEVLRPGPAAHGGVRFANLSAGSEPPSFVGRGGLGRAMAELGLSAWLVQASPVLDQPEEGWVQALLQSPRLVARAAGERLQEAPEASWQATQTESRHGCRGCPTPCGFTFRTEKRRRTGARFSALEPLLPLVSDRGEETAHELLAACNALGIDAREAGMGLAGLAPLHWPAGGSEQEWVQRLRKLCLEAQPSPSFRLGVAHMVAKGELPAPTPVAQGEAQRQVRSVAERVAAHLGQRGSEPLRSYGFLVGDRADPQRVEALVAPLKLPEGSTDPQDPRGKGRLLWWHENLIAGVDTLGICAFSVAGVLADGVLDVEQVAQAILPPGASFPDSHSAAGELLAVGAHTIELFRRLGQDESPDPLPADLQGPAQEYARLREGTRAAWGSARAGAPAEAFLAQAQALPGDPTMSSGRASALRISEDPQGAVRIQVRAGSTLARRLPAQVELRFAELPTVLDILTALARRHPRAAPWLVAQDRPVPAVAVAGAWVQDDFRIPSGSSVDLILALSGG